MKDDIQKAYDLLGSEIERLTAVRAGLKKIMAERAKAPIASAPSKANGHALPGSLPDAITGLRKTLPKTFRKRDVIATLQAQGYQFSLEPNYVAKTMGRLVADKVLRIEGDRNTAVYEFR